MSNKINQNLQCVHLYKNFSLGTFDVIFSIWVLKSRALLNRRNIFSNLVKGIKLLQHKDIKKKYQGSLYIQIEKPPTHGI